MEKKTQGLPRKLTIDAERMGEITHPDGQGLFEFYGTGSPNEYSPTSGALKKIKPNFKKITKSGVHAMEFPGMYIIEKGFKTKIDTIDGDNVVEFPLQLACDDKVIGRAGRRYYKVYFKQGGKEVTKNV